MANETLLQIYTANPTTSLITTDIMYIIRSPYTTGDDFGITWGDLQADIQLTQSQVTGLRITDIAVFSGLTLADLTESRLVASDSFKDLTSVSDLTAWVVGSTNRVTSTSNGAGGTTIDIASNYVGQTSITTLGTITTGVFQATPIALAYGGSNANLTANIGGIVYSTASALGIAPGTVIGRQALLSSSLGAPAWSSAVYPATTTINQLLYSSGNNNITGLATANSAALITNAGGVPSWAALTDGQLIIGSSSGPPIAANITAGTGIAITNGNNSIMISSTTAGSGVTSATGTAGMVLVNSTVGTPQVGPITLTLPQSVATSAIPTFNGSVMTGNYTNLSFTAFLYQNLLSPSFIIASNVSCPGASSIYVNASYTVNSNASITNAIGILVNTATLSIGGGGSIISNAYGIYVFQPFSRGTGQVGGNYAFGVNGDMQWTNTHIVQQFVPVSDANYGMLPDDMNIAYTALSTARTVTLPSMSSLSYGTLAVSQGVFSFLIKDESGSCSMTNTITIIVTGGSGTTIDGVSSVVINTAYGVKRIYVRPATNQYFTY